MSIFPVSRRKQRAEVGDIVAKGQTVRRHQNRCLRVELRRSLDELHLLMSGPTSKVATDERKAEQHGGQIPNDSDT
jgi:hypothetical protein